MSDQNRAEDGGYVHRPEGSTEPASEGGAEDGFGRRGWILVGVVFLATIVVPGIIYLFPAVPGEAGLPFIAAMLVLPMLPAVVLGLAAVWSMTAANPD
ncbi:MAG: hypothetical protein ABEJ74_02575 [Haloferacaceae archaeon]